MSAVKKRRLELVERDLNLSRDLRHKDLEAVDLRECHVRAMLLMDLQKVTKFSARVKISPLRDIMLPEYLKNKIASYIYLPGCESLDKLIHRASAHRARSKGSR